MARIKAHLGKLVLLPSFLCLDAPAIAVGWTWCLALSLGGSEASVRTPEAAALFFSVWAIYLGDRILDSARRRDPTSDSRRPTMRHAWAGHHIHVLGSLAAASAVGLFIALPGLEASSMRCGTALASATALYYLVFRLSPLHALLPRTIPGKEISIALCFAGGVALAATSGRFAPLPPLALAGLAVLFAGNCLLVARVESERDRDEDPAAYFSRNSSAARLPETFLAAALALSAADAILDGPTPFSLGVTIVASTTLALAAIRPLNARTDFPALVDGAQLLALLPPMLWATGIFGGK